MSLFQNSSIKPEYLILFSEATPPGPEVLKALNPSFVEHKDDREWRVDFDSLKGCEVRVVCDVDRTVDLRGEAKLSSGLSDKEMELSGQSRSRWHITIDPGRAPLLNAQKIAIMALGQLLNAVQTSVGVYAIDSYRVWSIPAIADELITKAAVDIRWLYNIHAVVYPDGSKWIHTHGLGALGKFDIDFLNPSDEIYASMNTLIRAMVFAILEGLLVSDDPDFHIAEPGGVIQMVPVEKFDQLAGAQYQGIRDSISGHTQDRSVVCEPSKGKKLFGLLKERVEPSRFVRLSSAEHLVCALSKTASDILAQRAQETYPILVNVMQEFSFLNLPVIAKAACPNDSGDGNEHVWFSVQSADVNGIDATCLNQPYDVSGLQKGDHGQYGIGQITEWQVQTPLGTLSPGNLGMVRTMRSNRTKIEKAMQEFND